MLLLYIEFIPCVRQKGKNLNCAVNIYLKTFSRGILAWPSSLFKTFLGNLVPWFPIFFGLCIVFKYCLGQVPKIMREKNMLSKFKVQNLPLTIYHLNAIIYSMLLLMMFNLLMLVFILLMQALKNGRMKIWKGATL